MADPMDSVAEYYCPRKGQPTALPELQTISLISNPSKVMLKVILNRLKPQAEEIIAEEQAGFRAGRSTTEQLFNLRIVCEKYLQHQQNLYHVFIDFKRHLTGYGMQPYGPPCGNTISFANPIRAIEHQYDNAIRAVHMSGNTGEWFRTTDGVRQGCLLSPTHFNIFREIIVSDALGWSGGAMVLGTLPGPGRSTIWMTVGQGPIALAVGVLFGHFYSPLSFLSSSSLSLTDDPI